MSVNHPFVTVPRRHGLSGTSSFGTSLSVERKEQPNKQKEEGTMKEDEEKNVTVNAPVQKKKNLYIPARSKIWKLYQTNRQLRLNAKSLSIY